MTTKFEELPLHYKHPSKQGTLVFSFAMNSRDKIIPNRYFWAIQNDNKEVTAHGEVKGLVKLNKIRNEFIYEGWERYLPPKIKVNDKKEEPKIVSTGVVLPLSPEDEKARNEARELIRKQIMSDTRF